MNCKRIIIEAHIPFIRGVFEKAGIAVDYLKPQEITADATTDADAIIVRTRTRCDSTLLGASRCSMVASATIGTDHIDLDWCRKAGIAVANAPGCNAPAVAQYVLASIFAVGGGIAATRGATLGVVGCGHVGSIVAQWARSLGFNVMVCDPPLERLPGGKSGSFLSLDEIADKADFITFHTPLTRQPSPDPTFHLISREFIAALKRRPVIINSARGAVADTDALLEGFDASLTGELVIDCWEGEPMINRPLLERAAIATPHIAGYSRQGKIRASQMAVDAVCRHFGLEPLKVDAPVPKPVPAAVSADEITASYDPLADTLRLKSSPELFEQLRNTYDLRNEPHEHH